MGIHKILGKIVLNPDAILIMINSGFNFGFQKD